MELKPSNWVKSQCLILKQRLAQGSGCKQITSSLWVFLWLAWQWQNLWGHLQKKKKNKMMWGNNQTKCLFSIQPEPRGPQGWFGSLSGGRRATPNVASEAFSQQRQQQSTKQPWDRSGWTQVWHRSLWHLPRGLRESCCRGRVHLCLFSVGKSGQVVSTWHEYFLLNLLT